VLQEGQSFKVKAVGDGATYLDSAWSQPVTHVLEKLSRPQVTLDGNEVSWEAVAGASGYKYKINNGADACPSFPIYEDEIKPILFEVFSDSRVDAEALLETYAEMFESLEGDNETVKQMNEQKRIIELANQKKNKLLELLTTEAITTANFTLMTNTCDNEIEKAQSTLTELETELFNQEEYRKHIAEVKTRLEAAIKAASSGMITTEFVAQYIDKIFVTSIDDDTANLEIKIFTGKNTAKWLKKLNLRAKGRMGVTSKKMIESYENSLQNGSAR
jgi:hypothetical protein